jgi:hypothetical protein
MSATASGAITQWRNAGRMTVAKRVLKNFITDRGLGNPAGIVQGFKAHEKRLVSKYL